jgi:type I restriction enzyme M protein
MPRAQKTKQGLPQSTAQDLASIVKSCRDIMRKDKGLSGDLDRLPMLTWIMFLKFLDDMENIRQEEAKLAGKRFRPAMESPYRWRDWAANPQGMTGPELLAFVNQDEANRPDGKRGDGLFAYLRSLRSANGDRRDVIANVFQGTINRMTNGYLLRDVVNKVNDIHFTSKDEIHTLGLLYESMLREMRDAAGDSGEFYTPRPVVKFIVSVIDPKLGETVLDPAAGTGGFLVEAFLHLRRQSKTADDFSRLQKGTLFGIEPKPLPYLLCQMNLLLNGLEYPEIDPGNALRFPLREIGDKDRVDIIMTNPPFGGEEERGILSNFPEDKQTAETALLFLQLIMRKLRRPVGGAKPGRCGMVISESILTTGGVFRAVRQELLQEFRVHAVVKLPPGVFSPYAPSVKTCLLFFERGGPTSEVWFHDIEAPDSGPFTKSNPLTSEHLKECLNLISSREISSRCWLQNTSEIASNDFNLAPRNPNRKFGFETLLIPEAVMSLAKEGKETSRELEVLSHALAEDTVNKVTEVPMSKFLKQRKEFIVINDSQEYTRITVQLHGRGLSSVTQSWGRN